jgi:hypothetical protein
VRAWDFNVGISSFIDQEEREESVAAERTDVAVSVMVCRPTGTGTKGRAGSPSSPAGPNAPRGAVAIGTNSSSKPTSRGCWQVRHHQT